MIQILIAILAGILTIAAPCILPLLPIILGTSVGQTSKARPLLIVSGFIVSFAAVSLFLSALVQHLGLSASGLRVVAEILLALFAVFMIWPKPFELLMAKLNRPISAASSLGRNGSGNWGALLLGLTLGIVWAPCAGPVLGAILTLIATQGTTAHSSILLVAYALGAGIPLLLIAYGGQWLTTRISFLSRYSMRLQQIFGMFILAVVVLMYFNYDAVLETKLTNLCAGPFGLENTLTGAPQPATNNSGSGAVSLGDYGPAPDFTGITHWLNLPMDTNTAAGAPEQSLSLQDLKGKVVLVDFWTYSCINCIRTLPYVTSWYNTYHNQGLVVVGVHTPEFEFEKDTGNVASAIQRFNIPYPVAQDNNYGTWKAYNNEYWPAEYLIDQNGRIVYEHFGEGNYDHTENAIRQLLKLGDNPQAKTSSLGNIESPEMYFGTNRLQYLTDQQYISAGDKNYTFPKNLGLNEFAMQGTWKFQPEQAVLDGDSGGIQLKFSSGKVFMVAAAPQPTTVQVWVDGVRQNDVIVQASQLYTLFDSHDYRQHTLELKILGSGFTAFTFTFG